LLTCFYKGKAKVAEHSEPENNAAKAEQSNYLLKLLQIQTRKLIVV
jgi:hypothetical protein